MNKNKTYSNIQDEEDHFDDNGENTESIIYGEPFVDNSLSKAPDTISPRGDSIRVASPISPTGSDMARAATMPDNLSKFRMAAQTVIHARRMSSKYVYAARKKKDIFLPCITATLAIAKAQQRQGKRGRARSERIYSHSSNVCKLHCPFRI